jgi:hypothetical protein
MVFGFYSGLEALDISPSIKLLLSHSLKRGTRKLLMKNWPIGI